MAIRTEVTGLLFDYELETAKMFGHTHMPSRMRHGGHVAV
jgi:hypothetical protein